jgi:excisionase family DNA binding protein
MKRFSSHLPSSFAYLPASLFGICRTVGRGMVMNPSKSRKSRSQRSNTPAVDGPPGDDQQERRVVDKRLLTVKQAAQECQLSVRHIRRMIKSGILPVIRFGNAIRIHSMHLGL